LNRGTVDVVDWGRSAPSEMITLNALRILNSVDPNNVDKPDQAESTSQTS
jgi:hypothetical protein